ncbi:GHKL domain-containing protein [Tenacibaculum adriaticum]|uniref:GHKL domain-containing protein n=1 Tax=Tenacibaculum adriaticum TaxID=413713 RepID=A0A5S5DPP7_9FLAO|nr:histidine kinase [Tenacibaculum adriaticum]TYP97877.1 GHKL domain-containing protein [Tenacibaculum adriaticum]
MIKWINNNKKTLIIIGLSSVLIPILIITYIIITSNKESVVISFDSTTDFLLGTYYVLLILGGVSLFVYWILKQIKTIINLKNEKVKTELMHLQSQVNPHFFFNMLNNLYGLIEKDTDKAKELILKLSDMMRFSIYEGQKEQVMLNEEVDFITNFIELHKMRYHKNIDIDFKIAIEEDGIKTMPLLFIILVENAFKHGVETLRNNAFVYLSLKANKNEIYFEVKNNFEEEIETKNGLGLKNLKRRLELVYPNRHKISFSTDDKVFKTTLILKKND